MPPTKHFMIVAGEVSGDSHAAALVSAIKRIDSSYTFSGLGGPKMREAGVGLDEEFTKFAVVGFFEVLKHYGYYKRCFDQFLQHAVARKPDAVILVDYPGFNLRLAARLKKINIPVIYYISPQVWAWKENRVADIKKNVARMLVLFNFEKEFYAERGVEVDFVGHPLADEVHISIEREKILQDMALSTDKLTIGLLPGSRQKEIESLLPPMLDAAEILYRDDSRIQFMLLRSANLTPGLFEKFLTKRQLPLKILDDQFYNGLNACDLCIVTSGTATLETALLLKPMVVVYKTSYLTFVLAKALIKIPCIGLVNIVAGKKIVPECLQDDATGVTIAGELKKIYQNPSELDRVRQDLKKIKSSLGEGGASLKAAKNILEFLNK